MSEMLYLDFYALLQVSGNQTIYLKSLKEFVHYWSQDAYGYQICYSTKKNMSGAKKKVTKKLSKTLTGLKSKKKYYVKVRAFKKDSTGNRVYGKWSAVKAVKIK